MKPEQLEIERLRREVTKLKAERDILKKPPPTSRRTRYEVRLRREVPWDLAGGLAMRGARCLAQRLPCPADTIAQRPEVGLSRSHFFGQFKKCVGVSSQHYLDAVRLGIAERVLIDSVCPLNEVATDLGFSEQTHFARFFVLHTGVTPGNYRRRTLILHNRSP
ncbi:MAG: hypothetical protein JWN71_3255 [Xanthobacteraceae bacterium]|nr:hypothetical protein [Xanthobacteraceae bacterium]